MDTEKYKSIALSMATYKKLREMSDTKFEMPQSMAKTASFFIDQAGLLGLETDLPGHLVASMHVAAKLIRSTHKFKQDTYDDAANYLHQAELMQKEKNGKNN